MIEVRDGSLGKGVYATEPIEAGRVILRGRGHRVPRQTRHSFQVDRDTHIEVRTQIELINHACEPNCGLLVRRDAPELEVHSLRAIRPGEELSIDYATFESRIEHMTGPCLCGKPTCRGRVTGYAGLPDALKAAYGPYVAEYLRESDALVRVG